jgi:hypothetical protein
VGLGAAMGRPPTKKKKKKNGQKILLAYLGYFLKTLL